MTDNADVEWLREYWHDWVVIEPGRGQRLLAHIDQLEAEATKFRAIDEENARLIEAAESKTDINVRPTIHEIAAQMMAALIANGDHGMSERGLAQASYDAAEALIAEGRRRDGLQK